MKRMILPLIFLLSYSVLFAQQESWEEQQQKEKERWEVRNRREKEAWEQQAALERQHWQDMIDRKSAAWQAHVEAVKKKWQEMKFSDVRVWVGYGENDNSRFQADFENGNLKIEVLGAENESQQALQQRAIEIMHQLLRERMRPDEQPILSNQLPIDSPEAGIPSNYINNENYVSPDGRSYEKMTVNIPFRQDHLRIRAQRIAPLVKQYAAKHNVSSQLVMAIIHTESSFNPKAISTFRRPDGRIGHAYGLMQLVPFYGGKEAYEYLGGRGEPSTALLFNPESNIELGIVYLSKLKHHYFGGVEDIQNRRYMMTAGYNTGPHNVARAFVGKRDVNAAIQVINTMQPQRLYTHLLYNLPYSETRHYLQKVTQRISLY
jgi:membrane-bound lytic murein transglycosylase C